MGLIKEFFHMEIIRPLRIEVEQEQMHHARQGWISGKRSPLTHKIFEWTELGKPTTKTTK